MNNEIEKLKTKLENLKEDLEIIRNPETEISLYTNSDGYSEFETSFDYLDLDYKKRIKTMIETFILKELNNCEKLLFKQENLHNQYILKKRVLKTVFTDIAWYNVEKEGILNIYFLDLSFFYDNDLQNSIISIIKKLVELECIVISNVSILNVE